MPVLFAKAKWSFQFTHSPVQGVRGTSLVMVRLVKSAAQLATAPPNHSCVCTPFVLINTLPDVPVSVDKTIIPFEDISIFLELIQGYQAGCGCGTFEDGTDVQLDDA